MKRSVLLPIVGILLLCPPLAGAEEKPEEPLAARAQKDLVIAGVPYEEARAIVGRHRSELMQNPAVEAVYLGRYGLTIRAEKGTPLPTEIEGLRVKRSPPVGVRDHKTIEPKCPEKELWEVRLGRCVPNPAFRPPPPIPPGVTILWPEGTRKQAESCPPGLKETKVENGRRFCVHPKHYPRDLPFLAAPPAAGMPYEEARTIFDRHEEWLYDLPGVEGAGLGKSGITIVTDQPHHVPFEVEGVPVLVTKPMSGMGAENMFGKRTPRPQGQASFRDSLPQAPRRKSLPPPPGVIILRPDGVREEAEACPTGWQTGKKHGWRFCIDPDNPQPIPPITMSPIAGIPYEEAKAILERHRDELMGLDGVNGVGLGVTGIYVFTDEPEIVPAEREGLPIVPLLPFPTVTDMNHTNTSKERPVYGGVAMRDILHGSLDSATLTGIVLSQGKPWLVFPAHAIWACHEDPPCPPTHLDPTAPSILNECPHATGNRVMLQPPIPGDADDRIGFIQRWVPPVNIPDLFEDVAAAFMDSNTDENDGSLSALRRLGPQMFTGKEAAAVAGEIVRIETSNLHSEATPPTHTLQAEVLIDDVQFDQAVDLPGVGTRCCPGCPLFITTRPHQNVYGVLGGYEFMVGDSGSPVLDQNGNIVGMANWFLPSIGEPETGGGTNVATIKDVLGYDTWLGTETTPLTGHFDTIASLFGLPVSAWGWALDPANPGSFIQVEIYVDGPKGVGALAATIVANDHLRWDVDPNVNRGFRWEIPSQYQTGAHEFYIYAKEHSQSNFTTLLPGSPMVGPDSADGFDDGTFIWWSNVFGF